MNKDYLTSPLNDDKIQKLLNPYTKIMNNQAVKNAIERHEALMPEINKIFINSRKVKSLMLSSQKFNNFNSFFGLNEVPLAFIDSSSIRIHQESSDFIEKARIFTESSENEQREIKPSIIPNRLNYSYEPQLVDEIIHTYIPESEDIIDKEVNRVSQGETAPFLNEQTIVYTTAVFLTQTLVTKLLDTSFDVDPLFVSSILAGITLYLWHKVLKKRSAMK
ncbi:hypothetical protein [Lactococcus lactis]|uniref:hypothetical protein n=1 Tax=Lactococcus lactis TaxID=1358 RepID=UPI002072C6D0|nr:hypothetical protein [Lactococcus lactis]MCT0449363.1 hypothetical protein [Lactococcus lactis subsp. lactis]